MDMDVDVRGRQSILMPVHIFMHVASSVYVLAYIFYQV